MLFAILKVLIFSLLGGFIGQLVFRHRSDCAYKVFREIFEISFIITGVFAILIILSLFINI